MIIPIPESRMLLHVFTGQVGTVLVFAWRFITSAKNLSNGKKRAYHKQKTEKKNKNKNPLEAS